MVYLVYFLITNRSCPIKVIMNQSKRMTKPLLKFMTAIFLLFSGTLNAQVQINEFMAINNTTLMDEDLDYPDWLEIKNTSSNSVDLSGWYLTDDAADLTKWQFPSTNILPNALLIVFASDKDRSIAGSELHAGFKLSGGGEYLAVINPDGTTIVHEYAPTFPPQLEDLSYGIAGGATDLTLIADEAACTARVPTDDSEGTSWQLRSFDDSLWTAGTLGVGYENSSGYESLFDIDLLAEMYGINATAYIRIPFVVPSDSDVLTLSLRMKYDDGFIAYINGVAVASANAPALPTWNTATDVIHNDTLAVVFENFDISAYKHLLVAGQNMLAIHAFNRNTTSSDLLIVPELTCRITSDAVNSTTGYLEEPTPGTENTAEIPMGSEPVIFSAPGALCDAPVTVELFATNSAEKIYYTLDGSQPSITSSEYSGAITISSTASLRARSFESGLALGPINSETYLFLESSVRSFSSDLPIVIVDNLGGGDIPSTSSQAAFLAFFEQGADGRTRLTNNFTLSSRAGIRRRGESSLRATTQKPNLAVESWGPENNDDYKIAPFNMPSESDWILWAPYYYDRAGIRNTFMYELSNQTGNYAVRTRFVEVFLNAYGGDITMADYAGLYVFMEKIKRDNDRVDVESMSSFDNTEPAISGGYILRIDKTDPDQNQLSGMIQPRLYCIDPLPAEITVQQEAYISNYIIDFEAQMSNPDPATGYQSYIETDAFIDHNMLNLLSKNADGLRISTYMYKPRNGKLSMGPIWDFDRSLESTDGRDDDPLGWDGGSTYIDHSTSAYWWGYLFENADFWQQYIDRWQGLRANIYSETNINAIIDSMAAEIAEVRVRDIAKWGQNPRTGSNGLNGTQQGEINYIKWWLAARMNWIDSQLINQPVLSHNGAPITESIQLSITAQAGTTIYYTLDGTDPRAPGGLPSPTATAYSGTLTVQPGSIVQARAWNGIAWGFNPPEETPWSAPVSAIYPEILPSLFLTEVHYNPGAPPPISMYDNDDFEFVELHNTGVEPLDLRGYALDGGIEFTFKDSAVESLPAGEYVVVVRNLEAFARRYNTNGMHIAGEYSGSLANSGENIRLEFYNWKLFDISYNDARGWPVAADGGGPSLIPVNDAVETQGFDILDYPGNWRASTYINGSPGEADPVLSGSIVINELMAHTDTGLDPPYDSNDRIELYNPTDEPVTLDEFWFLSDNVSDPERWNIPTGSVIPAKGWVVFDEDDFHPGRLTGFGVDKAGEQLVLSHRPGAGADRIVDCLAFKGQANDASWGRYPDGNAFFQTLQPTPATANQLPAPGIYIQELMYNPWPVAGINEDEVLEYILLTNASANAIVFDGGPSLTNTWRLNGGVEYNFDPGISMAAGEQLWLVPFDPAAEPQSKAMFCFTYTLNAVSVRLLGPYSGDLSDSGERLALERPQAADDPLLPEDISWIIVDEITWLDEVPWPHQADGTGLALLRCGSAGNDPQSWTTASGTGIGNFFASEKLTPGLNSWTDFTSIPNLSINDYADLHSDNGVAITLPAGTLIPNRGGVARLINGYGQSTSDDPRNSNIFVDGTTGRVQMDLQKVIPIAEINTYSWHSDERQNQHYDLYYSAAATAPNADSSVTDPATAGWLLLGSIQTGYEETTSGQIGVSLYNRFGDSLVYTRHLLWDIKDGSTYYGEFDVFMNGSFLTNSVPDVWLMGFGLTANDATALLDSDGDGLYNWEEYYAGTSPVDASSVLTITQNKIEGGQQLLQWKAVTGKSYSIKFNSGLSNSGWTTIESGIPGVEPVCSRSIPVNSESGFIRVIVE